MIQFIIDKLGPTFYKMGVSEADFSNYVTKLSGYIYFLLAVIGVFLVTMVAAHWVKKGLRHMVRLQALFALVTVLTVTVNTICYGPMYNNVSNYLNTPHIELSEQTTNNSKDVVKQVGQEGFVLAKNTGLLPLDSSQKNLNVFGWAATSPFYGGTGSGSTSTANNVGILESFKKAGFNLNENLTKMYTDYMAERPTAGALSFGEQVWTLPEPTVDHYTDELMKEAKEFSDTAVVVIGRSGGEGADLPIDMSAVIDGTYNIAEKVSANPSKYGYFAAKYDNNGTEPDFEKGESYLELSRPEEDMIDKVCSNFDNVIVIINSNNTMELGWVDNYDQIGSVILAPGAGVTGFEALGEIVNGTVNPSGKTVDTFVKDLFKTPYINNIGNHSFTNVDDLKQAIVKADESAEGNIAFVNYAEGIYVGYKFYETAAEEGLIKYEDMVQYPFGYGLSFTTFEKVIENFKDNGDSISFDVKVTNTGDVAGKDVVQMYYTAPYTNGGIEKASVNLLDFGKTQLLEAGASETLSFHVNKEDMASYDSSEIKVKGGGYILEAGEYTISLREDSHTVIAEEKFSVEKDIKYNETGRSTDKTNVTNQFEEYSRGKFTELSRKDGFANYKEACGKVAEELYVMDDATRAEVEAQAWAGYDPKAHNNADDVMPTTGKDNGKKLYEYVGVDYEDASWDELLDQMSIEDMINLVNLGGWQTAKIDSVGKVATADCDGPAGLNNFVAQVTGTSFPAEVLMAQTWSRDILEKVGEAIGAEFNEAGFYGWYGPAMNLHRSAFAGRNFEYYSEDGILSGKLATAEVNGAVKHGVYAYIKHFALNDQETNRCSFVLTYASEQAIREAYLTAFEIPVKNFEGKGQAAMSGFNFIGTKASCANGNLLNNVLRDEWGFQGMVITDYNGSYGYMSTDSSIKNGNDLMLGFAGSESNQVTDTDSATTVKALRQASKNILYTVANSGYYADGNPEGGMDPMTKLFIKVDVAIVALVILGEVLVILNYRKKKKASAK